MARRRGLMRACVVLLLLGLLIEGLQALLPWRSAEPMDLLTNAVGVVAGALLHLTPLARLLLYIDGAIAPHDDR